jgi:hypothetical protein
VDRLRGWRLPRSGLRAKWVGAHTHEVFFRDTVHGFMAWALATFLGTVLLASAASSAIGGGVRAAATVAGGAAQGATEEAARMAGGISVYDVDTLFRGDRPDAANPQETNAQAARLLAAGLANGEVPPADRAYLAQTIASRAGISQADAQKRVDDVVARGKAAAEKARQAADATRKAASAVALFTALSMLIGAFIASAAAACGGSARDELT